jgi:hypothetical protein
VCTSNYLHTMAIHYHFTFSEFATTLYVYIKENIAYLSSVNTVQSWAAGAGVGARRLRIHCFHFKNCSMFRQYDHFNSRKGEQYSSISERALLFGRFPGYGLDGPGIEFRCVRDFPHLFRPALGPTQTPIKWVPCLFPGVKRPGLGVDHPPSSSAKVKEKVQQFLYSPSGPSWPVLGRTVPLPLPMLRLFLLLVSATCR